MLCPPAGLPRGSCGRPSGTEKVVSAKEDRQESKHRQHRVMHPGAKSSESTQDLQQNTSRAQRKATIKNEEEDSKRSKDETERGQRRQKHNKPWIGRELRGKKDADRRCWETRMATLVYFGQEVQACAGLARVLTSSQRLRNDGT